MKLIATIQDVAERHLCSGCGMCAFAQPGDIEMVDDIGAGRRPVVASGADTSVALRCCPGVGLEHPQEAAGDDPLGLFAAWGPVVAIWEGHSTDTVVRFRGSSGGLATALGIQALADGLDGVVHIRARSDEPLLNETTLSTTVEAVIAASGSRYAPASPCDGLRKAVDQKRRVVFIGKPCDVAAVNKARAAGFTELNDAVVVTVAIFCAGAPSTEGTLRMLEAMGIASDDAIESVRYRGEGWPGNAKVKVRGESNTHEMTYAESWGILQSYRPWRCRVCADHTGEFADVAVGDPWYQSPEGLDGSSLIIARTERGREFVLAAAAAGRIVISDAPADVIERSQLNLLKARGAVWGRVLGSRLVGFPAPRYRNLPTFRFWWSILSVREKVASVVGTVRRLVARRMHRRRPVERFQSPLRR